MSSSGNACLLCALFSLPVPTAATAQISDSTTEAQAPSESAAAAARDAFGEQVGINQAGLYSPVQTRGFDLMAGGGAFRLDGFYFQPAAFPSESLISGLSVNVGISATALDLPSPTGVVSYRLRDPGDESSLSVTTGLREEESPHVEILGSLVSQDQRWAAVGHALIVPDVNRYTGEDGTTLHVGTVGRWMPGPNTRLRLFGSYSRARSEGDISLLPAGDGVPPSIRPRLKYSPDWARSSSWGSNIGALLDHRSDRWSVGIGAIHSVNHVTRGDVTILEVDDEGNVDATLQYTPAVETRSDSLEAKVSRTFTLFGAEHRVGAAVRQRSTVTGRALAVPFPAGSFTLEDGPPDIPAPPLPEDSARGRDRVDQRIVSATYNLQLGSSFDLSVGAHSNRYEKRVRDFSGAQFQTLEKTWLYSASAIWRPDPRLQVFASYVGGLEESGTAPSAAVNRGEVLPPVKARQYEFGARFAVTPELSLIAAAFDIQKPIYGLRGDGFYAPVGTVRHRGIEGSLTGRLTSSTTVVLGANLVQPIVSGEQVDAGLVRKVAPGVSRFNATVSIEQQLTPEWSIDAYLLNEGGRRRDNVSTTEVRNVPWITLGSRYGRRIAGRLWSLRGELLNPIGRKGYYATPYGVLVPVPAATYRLMLTASF